MQELNSSFYSELSEQIKSEPTFNQSFENLCKEVTLISLGQKKHTSINDITAKKLIETAGIFALSTDEDKALALKILNGLLICDISEEFKIAIMIVLMRLGNHPTAIQLKDSLSMKNMDPIQSLDLYLRSEMERRYLKNVLSEDAILTDFQSTLLEMLINGESISFSAPTSAGKTYILMEYLTNLYLKSNEINACIVVPTKALISQLMLDFSERFLNEGISDVQIITTTTQIDQLLEKRKKRLFIFTQERLQYLLFTKPQSTTKLSVLIVDEAQKLNDGSRGIILESTIIEAIKRNPGIQLVCSSPLANNPERIGSILQHRQNIVKTNFSPVPQFIYDVSINRNKLELKILLDGTFKPIETNISITKPTSKHKQIALISSILGKDQKNIIFANGPKAAMKIAEALMEYTTPKGSGNIDDFVEFIDEEVHPLYRLKKYIIHGIAYHFSDMPVHIRTKVEELYKLQDIDYLCCTSTLLEGVNLPARNIFVHNPMEGINNPMTNQSFWNLVGRAGRLNKELAGSIYCINTHKWREKQFISPKNYFLQSATENVLKNYSGELDQYLSNVDALDKERMFETCTSIFVRRVIKNEADNVSEYVKSRGITDINEDIIKEIDKKVLKIKQEVKVPIEVLERNSSIDPRRQQSLLDFFLQNSSRIRNYTPLHPRNRDFLMNLMVIFQKVDSILAGRNNNTYKYAANIAIQWIQEKSLREIITRQIDFKTRNCEPREKERLSNDEQFVNKIIDEIIETINGTLVFHYSRLTQCYIDILNVVLKKLGMAEVDNALPVSIEFGISEPTSQLTISMGGSRSLAIRLTKLYKERQRNIEFLEWVYTNRRLLLEVLPRTMHEEFLILTSNRN